MLLTWFKSMLQCRKCIGRRLERKRRGRQMRGRRSAEMSRNVSKLICVVTNNCIRDVGACSSVLLAADNIHKLTLAVSESDFGFH